VRFHIVWILVCAGVRIWAQEGDVAEATRLSYLGSKQQTLGEYAGAERSFRRALHILEKLAGPSAEITAKAEQNLGDLYLELGRTDDAMPLLEHVLRVRRQIPGDHGIGLAEALDANGVLRILERRRGADGLFREALYTLASNGQLKTQAFSAALIHLACELGAQGRHREALPLAARAIELMEETTTATIGDRVSGLAILASIEAKAQPVSAETTIRRALSLSESSFGPDHPRTGWVLVTYARILGELHRAKEATPIRERADLILAGFKATQQSIAVDALSVR